MTRLPARGRILVLAVLFLSCHSIEARADFLITPYVGTVFGGSTPLELDIGAASSKHWTFGGSAAWLSDRILGVEADFSMVPGFFQNSDGTGLVIDSGVTTLTGNVIAALPLSVTRDSLRPYIIGGLGLLHASAKDPLNLINLNDCAVIDSSCGSADWLGLQLGAGAIGLITNRAGVRFDLRHSRALSRGTTLLGERTSKLSFWRATFGVTFRY